MPSGTCSIEDCGKPNAVRGWCHMHYARWQRHGDPLKSIQAFAPPEERFWRFVDKTGPNGCWVWTGVLSTQGYARFGISYGVGVQGSRFAYEMLVGPIPRGLHLLHSCDNPKCVNPDHLTPGTAKENCQDMIAKGRGRWRAPKGEESRCAKVTEADVRAIRASTEQGRKLAPLYGITEGTISAIRTRRLWKHVT